MQMLSFLDYNEDSSKSVEENKGFITEQVNMQIIDLCRREDIDLLLMKTPTFANNWYPSYDRILTGIAEENENCSVPDG